MLLAVNVTSLSSQNTNQSVRFLAEASINKLTVTIRILTEQIGPNPLSAAEQLIRSKMYLLDPAYLLGLSM